jgi:putative ABC transport system permease protein
MNKFREFLIEALAVLWSNRLRSLLTMLGLIIGVGSVITTLAVGDSMNRSVKNLLSPFSQAASFVSPKEDQPDPQNAAIRYEDAQRIAPHVADASAVYPVVEIVTTTEVRHTEKTLVVDTDGAGVGFDQTPLAEGRRFTVDDVTAHRHVAILSDQARQELFPDGGPVSGRSVRLAGIYYTVVAVQQKPLNGGALGGSSDDITVTVPYSLIPELGYTYVDGLAVVARDQDKVAQVGDEAIAALQKIHGVRSEYDAQDLKSVNDIINKTFTVLTLVVGFVAGISLLVGGVGIMNIMLVSVSERTREIGIRKAIGASRRDIAVQFLTEALMLCCIGGLIGLIFGVGVAEIVIHVAIAKVVGTVVSFAWFPIVTIAVAFSAGVGLIFGIYPAVRASYLNPIDCLRYE